MKNKALSRVAAILLIIAMIFPAAGSAAFAAGSGAAGAKQTAGVTVPAYSGVWVFTDNSIPAGKSLRITRIDKADVTISFTLFTEYGCNTCGETTAGYSGSGRIYVSSSGVYKLYAYNNTGSEVTISCMYWVI